MSAEESTQSPTVQQESCSNGFLALQEAARLDVAKLAGPGGATYLLIYLDGLQTSLEAADNQADVSQVAASLKVTLQRLWAPATADKDFNTSELCAGSPFRNALCRIYITLFLKLDGVGLFDDASGWLHLGLSSTTRCDTRILALHIYAAVLTSPLGSMLPSLALQYLTPIVRLFRDKSSPYRLRYGASLAISGSIAVAGQSLPTSDARELSKTLKVYLAHESGSVQRGAAESLSRLFNASHILQNITDIDQALQISLKAQETCDWQARQQHVDFCCTLLLLTQVPRSTVPGQTRHQRLPASGSEAEETSNGTFNDLPGSQQQTSLLSVKSMMERLTNAYNRSNNTPRGRSCIMQIVSSLFIRLEASYVCDNFAIIWECLLQGGINGPYASCARSCAGATEEYIAFIIGKVVFGYLFHEQEQLLVIQYFTQWLRNAAAERSPLVPGNQRSLQISLRMLQVLLQSLGQSTTPEILQLEQPLLELSRKISVKTSTPETCITAFANAAPSRLHHLATDLLGSLENLPHAQALSDESVQTYLTNLVCQTLALSSVVPLFRKYTLYASNDVCARLVSLASQILKHAGERDLLVSGPMISCAWYLFASLLTLPKDHISVHLPQILLLWRNALPKPSHRELPLAETRTLQDWIFLFSIRTAAIQSIGSFLRHREGYDDGGDVLRRIVALLNHAVMFEASAPRPQRHSEEGMRDANIAKLELCRTGFMSSLLEAFALVPVEQYSITNCIALTHLCTAQFVRARGHPGVRQVLTSLESTSQSIWESNLLPALASSGFVQAFDATSPSFDIEAGVATKDYIIEGLPRRSRKVAHRLAFELSSSDTSMAAEEAANLLDRAGRLLAILFPTISSTEQLATVGILSDYSSGTTGIARSSKNINLETVTSLAVLALVADGLERARKDLPAPEDAVLVQLNNTLLVGLASSDAVVRDISCRGIASLCAAGSSAFLSAQIQAAVAKIVTDTQPYVRAGYIQLLAKIYKATGAIAARPALKTMIDIAMTLVQDPHPVVHYWSLRALALMVETASLDFTPFVISCLVMLTKVLSLDSHDPEGGTSGTSSIRGDLPIRQAISAVVDQIVVAAGPGLKEDPSATRVTLALIKHFLSDDDTRVMVQAGSALQHLLLVLPSESTEPALLQIPVNQLFSPHMQVQVSAVNSLYQIVRRDATTVSKLGGDKLVERLFTILDADPSVDGVKQTIMMWMTQTACGYPLGWLAICQRVLSQGMGNWQIRPKAQHKSLVDDEEAQGLGSVIGEETVHNAYLARWQTRSFALFCVISLVKLLEPLSIRGTSPRPSEAEHGARKLSAKISDLVRLALLSTTSVNMNIRARGLALLQAIITTFQNVVDEHSDGAPLLEQYQASIIAAAAPALEPEAEPGFYTAAIRLYGHFVSAGISRQPANINRAIKHLERSIRDTIAASSTASATSGALEIACGAAWARICIASTTRPELVSVVSGNAETLMTLWSNLLFGPAQSGEGDFHRVLQGEDDDGNGQPLDLESWLLVLKAWTILSMQPRKFQHRATSTHAILLGELCYHIDRYLLAESLKQNNESLAASLLDSLNRLLILGRTLGVPLGARICHDLLQIFYRLYILANVIVDAHLIELVATLAAVPTQDSNWLHRKALLQSCYRLQLALLQRNLNEGTELGLVHVASAWLACVRISTTASSVLPDGNGALPWALLHRHIQSGRLSSMPVAMLHSARVAAVHLVKGTGEVALASWRPLDQVLSACITGFKSSMTRPAASVHSDVQLYLLCLSVLSAAIVEQKSPMSMPLINDLCKCTEHALTDTSDGILAGGLTLAKSLSCRRFASLPHPVLAAHIVSSAIGLLGASAGSNRIDNTMSKSQVIQLLQDIGHSDGCSDALLLDVYAWLVSHLALDRALVIRLGREVSSLAIRYPEPFRAAYMGWPTRQQHALKMRLNDEADAGDTSSKNDSIAPAIELRSFSRK